MMMVMVVMMPGFCAVFHMAVLFVAMLTLLFQFQSCMADAVLLQFLANGILDMVGICAGDDVHGREIAVAVHAPKVDMMHVQHTVNGKQMRLQFTNVDAVRRFFQEKIQCFF